MVKVTQQENEVNTEDIELPEKIIALIMDLIS